MYALEFVDEEGRIVVCHFNKDGLIEKLYPLYSLNFKEPSMNSLYLSEVESAESLDDTDRVYYKTLGTISMDGMAYDFVNDLEESNAWVEFGSTLDP